MRPFRTHCTEKAGNQAHALGMATDVWLFNLQDKTSKRATDWEGTDTLPMWFGNTLYYLSDAGAEHRLNLWSYDLATGAPRWHANATAAIATARVTPSRSR